MFDTRVFSVDAARFTGAAHGHVFLALTPLCAVLTNDWSPALGLDITGWCEWSVDRRPRRSERGVELPTIDTLEGGLRAMIYPERYVGGAKQVWLEQQVRPSHTIACGAWRWVAAVPDTLDHFLR